MDRRNADLMLLDSQVLGDRKVIFVGIDWGRKDWTGAVCPKCQQPHRWRKRTPKHCRHCGVKFLFTANEASRITNGVYKACDDFLQSASDDGVGCLGKGGQQS